MRKLLVVLLALVPAAVFAQSGFTGTWKTDLSTIDYQGKDIFSLKDGTYTCDTCIPKIKVKADGQDQKVAGSSYYDTVSVREADPQTIEMEQKKNGKVVGSSKESVSEDGNTLSTEFTFTTETGQTGKGSYNSKRLKAAAPGAHKASGTWKPEKIESASDSMRTVTYKATDGGLSMTDEAGDSYDARFDGKDYAYKGDPGITHVSLKKIDSSTVEETDKKNGKPLYVTVMKVEPDGKIMEMTFQDKRRDVVVKSKLDRQ